MSLRGALSLALSNIVGDYKDAFGARCLKDNMLSIPLFRSAQFMGAWEGFRAPDHISAQLRERFYYPSDSKGLDSAPEPEPGRRIRYSQEV